MDNQQKIIRYWSTASRQDFETAEILFKNKLSIEKILKAIIVKKTKEAPPLLHNLVRLAEKTNIKLSTKQKNDFAEISTFNIKARYDDYKLNFYES